MKRANPTNEKIAEAQCILTYMERKVAHQKQRVQQLQEKQALHDMITAVELSSLCGRVIFRRGGTLHKTLDEAMRDRVLPVVMRSPATLQFKFVKDGVNGGRRIDVVALHDDTAGGLPLRYETFATQYLEQELLERADFSGGGETVSDRVLIYHTMPTLLADKFWRGPYNVLVSREFDGVISEDGVNHCTQVKDAGGAVTGYDYTEMAEIDDATSEPVEPPSEKEWKLRFAWKSPGSKLWYSRRTAVLLGKPSSGDF